MTNELATIEPLTQALALATEAGDINALRDVQAFATSMRKGAQARGLGIEAENRAAEVVLRAERAIGLALIALREAGQLGPVGGRLPDGSRRTAESVGRESLQELGINEPAAHRFRLLARMDAGRFEELIADHRNKGERIAKVNFYRDEQEESRKRAAKDIRDILADDDAATSVFETFRSAAEAMIADMSQTPEDELPEVARLIKRLYDAYVARMSPRHGV